MTSDKGRAKTRGLEDVGSQSESLAPPFSGSVIPLWVFTPSRLWVSVPTSLSGSLLSKSLFPPHLWPSFSGLFPPPIPRPLASSLWVSGPRSECLAPHLSLCLCPPTLSLCPLPSLGLCPPVLGLCPPLLGLCTSPLSGSLLPRPVSVLPHPCPTLSLGLCSST